MNKLEYICRQLSKARSKTFENYVITRIWHLLDDVDLKFITQQYVVRPEGRALTDMYFPQLKLHVEADEGYHKRQIQLDLDKIREADIINATGHKLLRVDATSNLESINVKIDHIISEVKSVKDSMKNFIAWDYDGEQNPQTYISKGYIDLKDDVAFKTMVDVANCFGRTYKQKGIWKGGVQHPIEKGKVIWFPRLYRNGEWENIISDDENTITERCLNNALVKQHIEDVIRGYTINRIVFARVKSPLGDIMYRFKGEYQVDLEGTNLINGVVLRRISGRVRTYNEK